MTSVTAIQALLVLMLMFCTSPVSTLEIDEIIENAAQKQNGHVRSVDRVIDQIKHLLQRELDNEQKEMRKSNTKRVEIDEIIENAEQPAQKKNDKFHSIDEIIVQARQMSERGNGKTVKRSQGSDYSQAQLISLIQRAGDKCEVIDELDIVMSCEDYYEMKKANENGSVKKRSKVSSGDELWPTDAPINYSFDPQGEFSDHDKAVVRVAMDEIERYTCLTFKLVDDADESVAHRIRFTSDGGCYSYVGMGAINDDYQDLSLGDGCRSKGTVVHELLHALGMWHEQSRPDRDDYVTVHLENVEEKNAHNYWKKPNSQVKELGLPYDYKSIMHYGQYAFSKDHGNLKTIVTKDPAFQEVIGKAESLSFLDIRTLALMYQCRPDSCDKTHDSCPDGGFVDENCRCLCESEHEGSRVKLCSASSGSEDACLFGDYEKFEFAGKVASCTEHIASSHNALYKICSDSDLRKHCCKTCADNKKADNPGCEFGDKSAWCATLKPHECYANDGQCCDTCAKALTGIEGCKYGDTRETWRYTGGSKMTCEQHTSSPSNLNRVCEDTDTGAWCCKTCADKSTNIANCKYGDREDTCESDITAASDCYLKGYSCCKTCDKIKDQLTYPTDCKDGKGLNYRGTVSVTESGKACVAWDSKQGWGNDDKPGLGLDSNSCRNPDGDSRPWCYTDDESWGYCDIPDCARKRGEKSDALLMEYLKRLLED